MFRYTKWTALREVVMVIVTLVLLCPFYLLVAVALKGDGEVNTTAAAAPPVSPTLDPFIQVLTQGGQTSLLVGLLNSMVITFFSVIGLIAVGSTCAYYLARSLSRLSTFAFYLVVGGIVVPTQLGLVPVYIAFRSLGLVGNQWGMVILYVGIFTPLTVFLYAGFVRAIPRDYEEAAMIDGASRWQTYVRVVFPMLAPATGAVATMTGLLVWNDFFNPLIFLDGSSAATLPLVMYQYVGGLATQWNLVFAVVIISMIPILIAYLFLQKRFMQGFAGGLKS